MAHKSDRSNPRSAAPRTGGARPVQGPKGLDSEIPGQPASAEPAYARPRLTRYGRLADVTATVGTKGKNDMSGPRKTGF